MSSPNTNRDAAMFDFDDSSFVHDGRGIEGALSVMSFADSSPIPSGNKKAAYAKFSERMLPQLQEEYPNLKLSQYKDKLFALWQKSPENPANFVGSDGLLGASASNAASRNAATMLGIARAASRSGLSPVPSRSASNGSSLHGSESDI
jgi:hypothetical protein